MSPDALIPPVVSTGAAVGVERQWSGHAEGQYARFAGLRAFTLLGLLGGLSGVLWSAGVVWVAASLVAGAAALIVAAYAAAGREDIDGTTEVAALVVLAAGVIAGMGRPNSRVRSSRRGRSFEAMVQAR